MWENKGLEDRSKTKTHDISDGRKLRPCGRGPVKKDSLRPFNARLLAITELETITFTV